MCDAMLKQQAKVKIPHFRLMAVYFFALTYQKEGIPEILLLLLKHRYLTEPSYLLFCMTKETQGLVPIHFLTK